MLKTNMLRLKTKMNGTRRRFSAARRCGTFERFAHASARAVGHPLALGLAIVLVLGWALTGPLFGFGDTWQLVINTATTVVTFLMVFLIQSTQNRDSEAMQLKLDELIRATKEAHNALLDIEGLSEAELDRIKSSYEELAEKARTALRTGKSDLGRPEVRHNGGGPKERPADQKRKDHL
jgi:low affinity Fe/Cu permease